MTNSVVCFLRVNPGRFLIAAGIACMFAVQLGAQDTAELLVRIKAMEDRINALETEVRTLKGQPAPAVPAPQEVATQAPSAPQSIGGAAGAFPPLVGWAAVTGSLSPLAWALFAIVFFWTPPHFWALSLLMKEEYAKVGVPMLPVVRGEDETRRQILLYSILLYAVTQLPFCAGGFGAIYLVASLALGLAFICGAVRLYRRADRRSALRLYLFSLAYLALLFCAMVADTHL